MFGVSVSIVSFRRSASVFVVHARPDEQLDRNPPLGPRVHGFEDGAHAAHPDQSHETIFPTEGRADPALEPACEIGRFTHARADRS